MKQVMMLSILAVFLLSVGIASAEACDPIVTLLNQDPYPAVPGDYVKLVFQVDNLENPECNDFEFELLADYPIEFDPRMDGLRTYGEFGFIKDYESNLLIPYEVRVNENALDGENPIEVRFQNSADIEIFETFNLEVEDSRVDFEIYVKNYDYATKEMTLEILNIDKADIEALTVQIPKQEAIDIKGSSRIVVGDLDSNEYTTADFEATLLDGEFAIYLIYSDSINVRRTIKKMVAFDSSYFTNRVADQKTTSKSTYVVYLIIIILIVWWILKRRAKKKKAKMKNKR
jgi:hypothetical protein